MSSNTEKRSNLTIKDGFKFGIGIFLAQATVGVIGLVILATTAWGGVVVSKIIAAYLGE